VKQTSALVLGVEDDALRKRVIELLADLQIEVISDSGRSVADLVVTYADRGRVVDAVLLAAQHGGAAAILLVVASHHEDARASARALGAHGYHALDGKGGELRFNVTRALHLARLRQQS
jgi:hypothetical protein